MKRSVLFFVLILLSVSIVLGQEISLLHTEYVAGETFQFYYTNDSLSTGQISLLDNDSNTVTITPLLLEYREEEYLVYFNLPEILSFGPHKILTKGQSSNFTIINETEAIQIKPAIIVLDKQDTEFSIEITNVYESLTVQIASTDSAIIPRRSSLSFAADESKNLFVDYTYIDVLADSEITFSYGSRVLTLPVIYIEEEKEIIIEENITQEPIVNITIVEPPVEVDPLVWLVVSEVVSGNSTPTEAKGGPIKIQNNLDVDITNLTFTLSGEVTEVLSLNETDSINLAAGEIYTVYAWINRNNDSRVGVYTGELTASNEDYSVPIVLSIEIYEPRTEPVEELPFNFSIQEPEEEQGLSGTAIIGIILIILLIIILIVIVLQVRKKEEKKFNQYIEETKRK